MNPYLILLQLFASSSLAHIEMSWPYPLRSKFNPEQRSQSDYDMLSPLLADGSNFPCKGYHNDEWHTAASLVAGHTYNLTLVGSSANSVQPATHGGGSCQISMSYDNGVTFHVIKSIIGGCPIQLNYTYTVPIFAPNGRALLAWTWQNLWGNREFYMNCAQVESVGATGSRTEFDSLPLIWKANMEGVTTCVTVEGATPVYPHPGVDVEYGPGLNSCSPVSPGICDF